MKLLSETTLGDLWVKGNISLLEKPGVGICGSRDVSESGLKHAREFGRIAAEHGFVVISGYARGTDTAAHLGAIEAGGGTVAVLAEGISSFRIRKDFVGSEDHLLAVSTYRPDDRWTVWRAMNRNGAIIGLSQGLFVIEAGATGGTLAAGYDCLKSRKPLYVMQYGSAERRPPGNQLLIQAGGIPVRTLKELRHILTELKESPSSQRETMQLELKLSCR